MDAGNFHAKGLNCGTFCLRLGTQQAKLPSRLNNARRRSSRGACHLKRPKNMASTLPYRKHKCSRQTPVGTWGEHGRRSQLSLLYQSHSVDVTFDSISGILGLLSPDVLLISWKKRESPKEERRRTPGAEIDTSCVKSISRSWRMIEVQELHR